MDPFFNNVKNSDFLVLLSDKFFEAHVALCGNEATDQGLDLSGLFHIIFNFICFALLSFVYVRFPACLKPILSLIFI
jgi:hypothetical protein